MEIFQIPKLGDESFDVKILQRSLKLKGFNLTADGEFGPKTYRAVTEWQVRNGFKGDGKLTPVQCNMLGMKISEQTNHDSLTREVIAQGIIDNVARDINSGLRETHGKNRSPRIDSFNNRTKTAIGQPYCASGLWVAVDDFCKSHGLTNPIPPTASSQAFSYGSFVPTKYIRRKISKGQKGDFAVLRSRSNSSKGHIVILTEAQLEDLNTFETGEYNTDALGSRDGDGAYFKRRSVVDSPLNSGKDFVCFVDIPQWVLDRNKGV